MPSPAKSVLFICTGNYYRSRFCEAFFNHLATTQGSDWRAFSRGVHIDLAPPGLSPFTRRYLRLRHISLDLTTPDRNALTAADLKHASLRIALKEAEHRPYIQRDFPEWENQVEYWTFHDLDVSTAKEVLPSLEKRVTTLFAQLQNS